MKNLQINILLSQKIGKARTACGLSVEQLAQKTAISSKKLSQYLNADRQIPFDDLLKICQSLNLDIGNLFDIDDRLHNLPDNMPLIKAIKAKDINGLNNLLG